MKLSKYLSEAVRTKSEFICEDYGSVSGMHVDAFHGVFGMLTEAVEILNPLKAAMYYRRPVDYINLAEELGDACWFFAILCSNDDMLKSEWSIERVGYSVRPIPDGPPVLSEVFKAAISLVRVVAPACEAFEAQMFLRDEEQFFVEYRNHKSLLYSVPSILEHLAQTLRVPMERILESNIAKLRKRYPTQFSEESANFRRLSEEREALLDGWAGKSISEE